MSKTVETLSISIAVILAAALIAGCWNKQASKKETANTRQESTDTAARKLPMDAKEALFEKLSGRLMEVIQTDGPAAAIAICKQEAPQMAIEIDPHVQQHLAQHYPQDQAIGYREGDLRGWFWVEVSASEAKN